MGDEVDITMVDTLYVIKPGRLQKTAILNRGGKTITPEIEKGMSGMDVYARMDKQHEYIELLSLFIPEGDLVMIYYMYGARNSTYADFFRRSDGELLTHIPMNWNEERESRGMAVEYDGFTFHTMPTFAQDGRWYAIIPESQVPGADENSNSAIISFTLSE